MKAPFEKFEIYDTVKYSQFVVYCEPRAVGEKLHEMEIQQREFIRQAIREKLERENP